MVAYSFKPQFAPLVESGQKPHTIRSLGRQRHARPGEALQLYTGMRTISAATLHRDADHQCRKLLDPDPICTETLSVQMTLFDSILRVYIDGIELTLLEIVELAIADGFGEGNSDPLDAFIKFFQDRMPFEGVLICWTSPDTHNAQGEWL